MSARDPGHSTPTAAYPPARQCQCGHSEARHAASARTKRITHCNSSGCVCRRFAEDADHD